MKSNSEKEVASIGFLLAVLLSLRKRKGLLDRIFSIKENQSRFFPLESICSLERFLTNVDKIKFQKLNPFENQRSICFVFRKNSRDIILSEMI
ncbi:hypothetical protein CH380_10180 [Leptospira adleri]|uniref:Uncharacterized protein n=1 Tax=Leptospira adleri TaxID=2023186 RepID=A0A2M9YPS8_9LEPT|nr:hypothetical protein CH380_10180 [Leptospira adleri]PJZ62210.1 hypothetical protein CH376_09050 [Leptospira adleri]